MTEIWSLLIERKAFFSELLLEHLKISFIAILIAILVCPGGILSLDPEKKVQMRPITEFGWNGCWQCEHCLAVCPTKAISVFGHCPQHSRQPEPVEKSKEVLDALILNRHSCRRYLNKNVDPDIIQDMLDLLANAPNGGNKQQVEFTIIDDKDQMENFR